MSKLNDIQRLVQYLPVAISLKELYIDMEDFYFTKKENKIHEIEKQFDSLRSQISTLGMDGEMYKYYCMSIPWFFSSSVLIKVCPVCAGLMVLPPSFNNVLFLNCSECGEIMNFRLEEINQVSNFNFQEICNNIEKMESKFFVKTMNETTDKASNALKKMLKELETVTRKPETIKIGQSIYEFEVAESWRDHATEIIPLANSNTWTTISASHSSNTSTSSSW